MRLAPVGDVRLAPDVDTSEHAVTDRTGSSLSVNEHLAQRHLTVGIPDPYRPDERAVIVEDGRPHRRSLHVVNKPCYLAGDLPVVTQLMLNVYIHGVVVDRGSGQA